MEILNIKCEYLTNPLGIDIKHPRITWNLNNCEKQFGYKIHYSINNGETKVTELIKSSSMSYIFEEDFHSQDIVTYQIEVFENENSSSISSTNTFEFGFLNGEAFASSKWFTGNYKVNKARRYPADYFKKEFSIDSKDIVKARLYITSCGLYEASLNGKRVGKYIFAPGSTDYRKRLQYQTYDVLPLLKNENNSLEIVLGDGWFRGTSAAWGKRNTYGKETKLIFDLELTTITGEIKRIVSDESVKWANDGPIKINDLKDGERVDASLTPSFNSFAKLTNYKTTFRCSNNYDVREKEHYKPLSLTTTKNGNKILTFPKNISGYIHFKVNAHKGDLIRIVMGEVLNENGELDLANIQCRSKKTITPLQEINYICNEGENDYRPKFYFGGFRYASVQTNVDIKPEDFEAIAIYSDFNETSTFECSNNLINIFYQNTLNSLKSNAIDIPTDCPTRERQGWTGDSQIFFNTAAYLVDYAPFARKHMNDIVDRQFKDGRYAQIVPYAHEDFYMATLNGSVGWADAGILIPYRFYKKYGDKRILTENLKSMERYIDFMISRMGSWGGPISKRVKISRQNRKYLVNKGQSYGEWCEPVEIVAQSWTDVIYPHPEVSTAYTVFTISHFQEILKILGKEDEAKKYDKYVGGGKKAYQELIEKNPEYSLDTKRQAQLVRPLYMNLLNEKQTEYAKNRLIKALDEFSWRIGTGFLSTPFILDVLEKIDPKYTFKLLENEERPGWLYMAKNSTTSIWESWEGYDTTSKLAVASLNHYSKGSMVEYLLRKILGIDVIKENEFIVSPLIGGHLTYAKGSYLSQYGKLVVNWSISSNKLVDFYIHVPGNTTATFKYKDTEKVLNEGDYSFTL